MLEWPSLKRMRGLEKSFTATGPSFGLEVELKRTVMYNLPVAEEVSKVYVQSDLSWCLMDH